MWGILALAGAPAAGADSDDGISDTRPSLLRDEWYTEGWDQLFYFPDGTLLVLQVTAYNMGFGDHHAGVIVVLRSPDGNKRVLTQSRAARKWEYATDGFDIRLANNRFQGAFPDYTFSIRKTEGEVDLEFRADVESWRLGRTMELSDDYRYLSFYAPVAGARSRYRFPPEAGSVEDAPWQALENGRGYAARYVNSTSLWNLILSSTRIVPLDNDDLIPVLHNVIDEEGGSHTYLGLFEDGALLHQLDGFELSARYELELAEADSRQIPMEFRVDAEQSGVRVQGTLVVDDFLLRVDPVDWVKPPVQYLLKKINTPIQYRYLARYDLTYEHDGRSRKLEGVALMDHIIMRHERSKFRDSLER